MTVRRLSAYDGQFDQRSSGTYSCLNLHFSRKALIARASLGINIQISITPAAPRVHNYSPQGLTLL